MRLIKKIVSIFIVVLFLSGLAGPALAGSNASSSTSTATGTPLEVVYPRINKLQPRGTYFGIPKYTKYIFSLAVFIIGFVILGLLIYNGFQYLISAGNPTRLEEARKGILYAFLGAGILLGAVLIFKTINPALTKLNTESQQPLESTVTPGVYICTYKADANKLRGYIEDYSRKSGKEQIEAAKKIWQVILPKKNNGKDYCLRASISGNFKNFAVTSNNTIFIIPTINYVKNKKGKLVPEPDYQFGIILHEKLAQRGKCQYFPEEENGNLYHAFAQSPGPRLTFDAHSFTLFKKTEEEKNQQNAWVSLFTCYNYNDPSMCPSNEIGEIGVGISGTSTIDKFDKQALGKLAENTRSVQIYPPNHCFALFFDEDLKDIKKANCAVIKESSVDINNIPIDAVINKTENLKYIGNPIPEKNYYTPKIDSIIVIRGHAL